MKFFVEAPELCSGELTEQTCLGETQLTYYLPKLVWRYAPRSQLLNDRIRPPFIFPHVGVKRGVSPPLPLWGMSPQDREK